MSLAPVYAGDSGVGYLLYDDQGPDGSKHDSNGHTKGGLVFDSSGGFWLVHSVPRFPYFAKDGYDTFPTEEDKYGQSFLCLGLGSLGDVDDVAGQFYYNHGYVFDSFVPDDLASKVANVVSAVNMEHSTEPEFNTLDIKTGDGQRWTSFAKTSQWGKQLYEELVAATYEVPLSVETWMNGINPLPSYCAPDYTYNVVNVRTLAIGGASWKETQDHSKWAVSQDGSTPIVCIGDINRQKSQAGRAGGTVCTQHNGLWQLFSGIISDADSC